MMNSGCAECRALAEELREALSEAASEPDFEEKWARFREMLGPEGDGLPVIGIRHDPPVASASKGHIAIQKMFAHHAKTGHRPVFPNPR
jgi:hypothetical protein